MVSISYVGSSPTFERFEPLLYRLLTDREAVVAYIVLLRRSSLFLSTVFSSSTFVIRPMVTPLPMSLSLVSRLSALRRHICRVLVRATWGDRSV